MSAVFSTKYPFLLHLLKTHTSTRELPLSLQLIVGKWLVMVVNILALESGSHVNQRRQISIIHLNFPVMGGNEKEIHSFLIYFLNIHFSSLIKCNKWICMPNPLLCWKQCLCGYSDFCLYRKQSKIISIK
jgi:hypothetical protein